MIYRIQQWLSLRRQLRSMDKFMRVRHSLYRASSRRRW